jgi:GntR family transcriptional regulator/MocR family aminotransferase
MEDPGYTAAHRLFETHRARVEGVPVDREGLVVDALPERARLVYVTPSHQFPTGVAMSLARRTALLQWAVRHDALIVEDDYDSEFRFADRPLEPLQSLDRDGRVVYVGSFSKTLLPLLRVGYAIAPASLQPALREAKRVTDWDSDAVTQGALARFMAEGLLGAHVRRATAVYRERREALLHGLAERFPGVLEVVPSAAGLHVCALLPDPAASDAAIVARAADRGVVVEALSPRFAGRAPQQGLVLGFGAIAAEAVPAALAALGAAL